MSYDALWPDEAYLPLNELNQNYRLRGTILTLVFCNLVVAISKTLCRGKKNGAFTLILYGIVFFLMSV